MKIGILTFHNAHNYGATLQAYALKQKLKQMGHEVEIVNYCNPAIAKGYRRKLHPVLWKRDVLPTHWKKVYREFAKCIYGQKEWEKQWEAFEDFIGQVLLEGKTREISPHELSGLPYELYILGSDQIWASYLTGGLDPVYFGKFKTGAKIMTYSASLPGGVIPAGEEKTFCELLEGVRAISVREEKLATTLGQLLNREVIATLDPTLLLEAKDYLPMEADLTIEEPFVFAYFVVEDDALLACATEAAKQQKCKLIQLHYYHLPWMKGENQIADIGPKEFIYYMHHAQLVLTNSFHGTVFSVLFHKPFFSVYQENGRIENLLQKLELTQRHIKEVPQVNTELEIDFTRVDERLEDYRMASLAYLDTTIKTIETENKNG